MWFRYHSWKDWRMAPVWKSNVRANGKTRSVSNKKKKDRKKETPRATSTASTYSWHKFPQVSGSVLEEVLPNAFPQLVLSWWMKLAQVFDEGLGSGELRRPRHVIHVFSSRSVIPSAPFESRPLFYFFIFCSFIEVSLWLHLRSSVCIFTYWRLVITSRHSVFCDVSGLVGRSCKR